jgi:hydrogenase maturation protease
MKRNRIAVIGLGNLLMKDEGVGLVAVSSMQRMWKHGGVDFVPAGTPSMSLLHHFDGRKKLIFVDGGRCGVETGAFRRFHANEVRSVKEQKRRSLHEFDLIKLIECAEKIGLVDDTEIVIYCIEILDMELGEELSEKVTSGLPALMQAVMDELSEDRNTGAKAEKEQV